MSTAILTGLRDYLYSTLSPANMMWLGTQLTEYAKREEQPPKPYTMEEINAMLDMAEADFEAGRTTPDEEVWRRYDERCAREEQIVQRNNLN